MCTRFVYRGDNIVTGFNFDIDLSVWKHKVIEEKERFYIGILQPDGTYHSYHGVNQNTRFKVYSKKNDIVLESGNVISGGYQYKGTLRVKELGNEYSIAKISRGRNIQPGDIARETTIGNFFFGLALNYASYKMTAFEKTYESSVRPNEGKLKLSLNKNDYALGLHLKMGYNGTLFSPNVSFGLLFISGSSKACIYTIYRCRFVIYYYRRSIWRKLFY